MSTSPQHPAPEPPGAPRSWSTRFLARFQRVTSSGNFISEIDGLRFIAIGTVVLFHLTVGLCYKSPAAYAIPVEGNWLAAVARFGFHGVELFFVISGFILAYPFASHYLMGKKPVNLRQYFLRRLTRLEPPYIVCMVTMYVVLVALKGGNPGELFPHLAASLVYLHNIIFGGDSPINNVAWSLEIEVQFYCLVPLLARVFAVRDKTLRRSIIIGVAALVAIGQWLFIGPESRFYLTIARFLDFFLIGFLFADIYILDWKENPVPGFGWDLMSVAGWPLLFIIWNHPAWSAALLPAGHEPVIGALLFPVLTFLLYTAVFRGRLTNRVMTNVWITTIGGMCYTIYLFHNQLIGIITSVTRGIVPTGNYTVNIAIQAVLVLPLMLAATSAYFALIERPCMKKDWPKRLREKLGTIHLRLQRKIEVPLSDRP